MTRPDWIVEIATLTLTGVCLVRIACARPPIPAQPPIVEPPHPPIPQQPPSIPGS